MKRENETILRGDASKLKVGIAVARFNSDITDALLATACDELRAWGVVESNIYIVRVAGSFELPYVCQTLFQRHKVHAAVALGCIVQGETKHDEYLAEAVFSALQQLVLQTARPIGLGILTVNSLQQAKARLVYGSAAVAAALEASLL